MRLIRSSPNRICGFIMPLLATTSPDSRLHRCPAMVVVPTSIARPYTRSLNPAQTATSSRPSRTATVPFQSPPQVSPARIAADRRWRKLRSASRPPSSHSRSSASSNRVESQV